MLSFSRAAWLSIRVFAQNPLHAIVAMVDFLGRANMTADDRECIQTIRSSVDMMRSIVNDALDMSKARVLRCLRLELSFCTTD